MRSRRRETLEETVVRGTRFRRWLVGALLASTAWLVVPSCKGGSDTLCTPGENIFCKCRGGAEGTKTCQPDGNSFDACVSDVGTCNEIPSSTSAVTSGGPATSSAGPTTSSGTGGGTSPIFTPCQNDTECATGECRNHYCTLDCGNYMDCKDDQGNIVGDCVRFAAATLQVCAPYCTTQSECTQFGAMSGCGGAKALDDPTITFAVCGDWGTELGPMPAGSFCSTDPDCNLGLTGKESICVFQKCTTGCYMQSDCPSNKLCSSGNGTPGTCN